MICHSYLYRIGRGSVRGVFPRRTVGTREKCKIIICFMVMISALPLFSQRLWLPQDTVVVDLNPVFEVPVHLEADGNAPVSALQFEITYDSTSLRCDSVYGGEAATLAGKQVYFSKPDSHKIRIVLFGVNKTSFNTGTLAYCQFSPLVQSCTEPIDIEFQSVLASDSLGDSAAIASDKGWVVFSQTTSISANQINKLAFDLHQNFPNPFNPSTMIHYELPASGPVQLTIYNIRGEEVVKLVDDVKEKGRHHIEWDAGDQSSGIYFIRFFTPGFTSIKKCFLIK